MNGVGFSIIFPSIEPMWRHFLYSSSCYSGVVYLAPKAKSKKVYVSFSLPSASVNLLIWKISLANLNAWLYTSKFLAELIIIIPSSGFRSQSSERPTK